MRLKLWVFVNREFIELNESRGDPCVLVCPYNISNISNISNIRDTQLIRFNA